MSQIYKSSTGGGGSGVTSLAANNGVSVNASTGAITVSGVNATTSTVGVASFNPANFTVSGTGEVSSIGGSGISAVNIQTFLTSGTYTPTTGMSYCTVEVVGGGGGGGGLLATSTTTAYACSGGGGGEYLRGFFTASDIGASQTVTVGAGGTAGAAGNTVGGDGGNTSLGSLIIAMGGGGSFGPSAPSIPPFVINGTGGGIGGTGGYLAIQGGDSDALMVLGLVATSGYSIANTSRGGGTGLAPCIASYFEGANGHAGQGSEGRYSLASASAQTGNAGVAGICIITEYIS